MKYTVEMVSCVMILCTKFHEDWCRLSSDNKVLPQ
jgi:hypothetical protein